MADLTQHRLTRRINTPSQEDLALFQPFHGAITDGLIEHYEANIVFEMMGDLMVMPLDGQHTSGSSAVGWRRPPGSTYLNPDQVQRDVRNLPTGYMIQAVKMEENLTRSLGNIAANTEQAEAIVQQMLQHERAQQAWDELYRRMDNGESEEINRLFNEKKEATRIERENFSSQVETASDTKKSLISRFAQGLGGLIDDAAAAVLDNFQKGGKRADGKRVSRQPHEYSYCLESGAIQDVLDQCALVIENMIDLPWADQFETDNPELVIAINDNTDASDFSFGNFVDAVNFRKTIAMFRKFRQFAFAANMKAMAHHLGTSREDILADMKRQWMFNEANGSVIFAELGGIFTDTGHADIAGAQAEPVISTSDDIPPA